MDVSKCLDGMTNSVDPVQTAPGLHSLLNPCCLNIRHKYGSINILTL